MFVFSLSVTVSLFYFIKKNVFFYVIFVFYMCFLLFVFGLSVFYIVKNTKITKNKYNIKKQI